MADVSHALGTQGVCQAVVSFDRNGTRIVKVLLVEDHAALREIVADYLGRRGFVIDAVGSVEEAYAATAAWAYDAVILDLGLPDDDGMALLRTVRARTARLPTIIVTARDRLEDRVDGLNAGADDYLVKPFELVELEARLRAILRRPGAREQVTLTCGAVVFDTTSRQASAHGTSLDLSRRESALLEELLRTPGKVVVKDLLEDRLYSCDEPVSDNALEAVVSRLRKKLASVDAGVRIDTKRGIGYRLEAGSDV